MAAHPQDPQEVLPPKPVPWEQRLAATLDQVLEGDYEQRISPELFSDQTVSSATGSVVGPVIGRLNELLTLLAEECAAKIRYRQELEDSSTRIELLTSTLRELSTPIIEVWRGVLCLPLIGTLDRQRSAHMMELLLSAVATRRAELVIVDLTGIEDLDAQTLAQLVNVARAIRLLGTECVLTGIRASIAAALATLDADVSAMRTTATLYDALAQHLGQAGSSLRPRNAPRSK